MWALRVAEQAAAGLQASTAEEVAAARWLDAEEAAMRQVLAWAMEHDPGTAARLADALGWWWLLRGRLPGQYGVLREVAARAEAGSDSWCAVQLRIILAAVFSLDLAGALEHATALRDAAAGRGPSRRWLTACLGGRSRWITWSGSAGRPRRRPGRWPWPGKSATRPGRSWP